MQSEPAELWKDWGLIRHDNISALTLKNWIQLYWRGTVFLTLRHAQPPKYTHTPHTHIQKGNELQKEKKIWISSTKTELMRFVWLQMINMDFELLASSKSGCTDLSTRNCSVSISYTDLNVFCQVFSQRCVAKIERMSNINLASNHNKSHLRAHR